MDWAEYYPGFVSSDSQPDPTADQATALDASSIPRKLTRQVEVADIGCGFGGLLVALAPELPDTLILGMFANEPDIM